MSSYNSAVRNINKRRTSGDFFPFQASKSTFAAPAKKKMRVTPRPLSDISNSVGIDAAVSPSRLAPHLKTRTPNKARIVAKKLSNLHLSPLAKGSNMTSPEHTGSSIQAGNETTSENPLSHTSISKKCKKGKQKILNDKPRLKKGQFQQKNRKQNEKQRNILNSSTNDDCLSSPSIVMTHPKPFNKKSTNHEDRSLDVSYLSSCDEQSHDDASVVMARLKPFQKPSPEPDIRSFDVNFSAGSCVNAMDHSIISSTSSIIMTHSKGFRKPAVQSVDTSFSEISYASDTTSLNDSSESKISIRMRRKPFERNQRTHGSNLDCENNLDVSYAESQTDSAALLDASCDSSIMNHRKNVFVFKNGDSNRYCTTLATPDQTASPSLFRPGISSRQMFDESQAMITSHDLNDSSESKVSIGMRRKPFERKQRTHGSNLDCESNLDVSYAESQTDSAALLGASCDSSIINHRKNVFVFKNGDSDRCCSTLVTPDQTLVSTSFSRPGISSRHLFEESQAMITSHDLNDSSESKISIGMVQKPFERKQRTHGENDLNVSYAESQTDSAALLDASSSIINHRKNVFVFKNGDSDRCCSTLATPDQMSADLFEESQPQFRGRNRPFNRDGFRDETTFPSISYEEEINEISVEDDAGQEMEVREAEEEQGGSLRASFAVMAAIPEDISECLTRPISMTNKSASNHSLNSSISWNADADSAMDDSHHRTVMTAPQQFVPTSTNFDQLSLEEKFDLRVKDIFKRARQNLEKRRMMFEMVPCVKKKVVSENPKPRKKTGPQVRLFKPAPWANKRLYDFLDGKLFEEFGLRRRLKAEDVVRMVFETVRLVTRNKNYQKTAIRRLKIELATLKIITTTYDFYQFVRNFLPKEFEHKVIPSVQPFTNIIWPPKDDNKKESEPILG